MHRIVFTFVAVHTPASNSTSISAVCKEVTGDASIENTEVFYSRFTEAMWEEGQDATVRLAVSKASDKFIQRAALDSPF